MRKIKAILIGGLVAALLAVAPAAVAKPRSRTTRSLLGTTFGGDGRTSLLGTTYGGSADTTFELPRSARGGRG